MQQQFILVVNRLTTIYNYPPYDAISFFSSRNYSIRNGRRQAAVWRHPSNESECDDGGLKVSPLNILSTYITQIFQKYNLQISGPVLVIIWSLLGGSKTIK